MFARLRGNRPEFRFSHAEPVRTAYRPCDHAGCTGVGEYRAPKNREQLREYWWFCLEHVRAYNAAWDYYAGMSMEEIERAIRAAAVGERPSWPLGAGNLSRHTTAEDLLRARVQRSFMGGEAGNVRSAAPAAAPGELAALRALGFELAPESFAAIKARYRQLVKENHPDRHGGAPEAAERMTRINEAFTLLKKLYETQR